MRQEKKKQAPIIEVEDLVKEFSVGKRKLPVLRGINLEIYFGEFVIIYGPSGCGKSTLLHTILGLEPPTRGTVRIKGENIFEMSEDKRAFFRGRKLGMVFQQSYWIKSLNVLDNVALPLNIAGLGEDKAKKRALDLLQLFDLKDLANQRPTELSGGEQQRVSLARALTTNPWIIIADEPTGNLDKKAGLHLMGLLESLNKESNRTIVIVTHNAKYHRYASQLLHMEDGRIIESKLRKKKRELKPVIA